MFNISNLLKEEMIKNGAYEEVISEPENQTLTSIIPEPKYTAHYLAGRASSAYSKDGGRIIHAVPEDVYYATALCGISHGQRSAGWFSIKKDVNCPKCL